MGIYNSTDRTKKLPRYAERTAVIYIRVSSQQQVENFSIPTQIESCKKYLNDEKLREVGMFVEEGESAKTSDRTQLQNLLYFISKNKKKVDYVVVYKLDRWSRSQSDFYALKSVLIRNGTNLLSVTEKVDDSPTGKFLEGIFSGLAQLDNEMKALRVKDCMKTKAYDGWYPVKAPYGYMNDPKTKTIIRNKKYFLHIQTILFRFAKGESIPDLVAYLKNNGVKTMGTKQHAPKNFTSKQVWRIMTKSKFYAGLYDWRDELDIKGKHEKMISMEQHYKIQHRLRVKNYLRTVIMLEEDEPEDYFYLNFQLNKKQGFLICDKCHTRMLSCFSKSKTGKRYPYYYCTNSKCESKKKSWQKADVEAKVDELMSALTPQGDVIRTFKEEVMAEWETEFDKYKVYCQSAKERVKLLEHEKSETIAMRRRQELTFDEFEKEMERIRIDMVGANVEVTENLINKNQLEVLLDQSELFLKDLKTLYTGFSVKNKQRFLAFIFPKGVFFADGKIRTPEKSCLFEYLEEIKLKKSGNIDMVTPRRIELRLQN